MTLPRRVHHFHLHTSLSREQLNARLVALDERGEGFFIDRRQIRARLKADRIHLHRDGGRNLIAEIRAEIKDTDGIITIEGQASIHLLTWLAPLLAGAFIYPLLTVVLLSGEVPKEIWALMSLGGVFGLVILGAMYWSAFQNRTYLLDRLTEAVS